MPGVWGTVLSVVKRILTTPTTVTPYVQPKATSNTTRRIAKAIRKFGHDLDPNHTVDLDYPTLTSPKPPNPLDIEARRQLSERWRRILGFEIKNSGRNPPDYIE